ncbi:hypothetical protein RJ640_005670 [Escallonia rubra]|uniref:Protein kinase domain-containing protein n=1 Tax=Escallonia rubra TaxID=112253 RepID=A0AA88UHA5_9ASTE|nr:hypothetical protein RJ640_005670 [Escallonia rubra]
MAPECATHGQFSEKSDVFSFGVLVLEIISGQKNYCFQKSEKDLLSYRRRGEAVKRQPWHWLCCRAHIPDSRLEDSCTAPKLRKLWFAFDFGNPIANGAIILIALLNVIVYYLRELQESNLDDKEKRDYSLPLPSSEHQLCRRFSFGELQLATNNFDDASVIGRGGFGKVYKGFIDNGPSIVAIKRLNSRSHQGAPEFRTEIELLSRFRHSHLVSLIGYCDECHEMILVYIYMPRGTLANHLHKIDKSSHAPLSWVQRLKICIGAARGLDYLHTGTGVKDRVIHRDVKSSNILLDEDWAAKISDFGMSKVGPANQSCTHVSTHVRGTFGYLDPDYYSTGQLTRKSDVYAFGVVLFEVLCGRPAVDTRLDDEEQWGLARWAKHCIKGGKVGQIIDPSLQGKILSDCLMVFVQIAEQCLCNRPKKRPTMAEVVAKLEYALALQERTYSVEGEGTADSSIKSGDGGRHAKHVYDDTRLGDASSRQSRTRPPRLPYWKRFLFFEPIADGPFLGAYSFRAIREATGNFSDTCITGYDAFGYFYKGVLPNGQEIAVKRMYMDNERAVQELKHPVERPHLDWHKRWKIIEGVARGLLHLHVDSRLQIIHGNLNADNVLLDIEMNPKISGFGLARSLKSDKTQDTASNICGTFGYLAPECISHGQHSTKSDVFSFGVLVLEIISGQSSATFPQSSKNAEDLLSYAWKCWQKGTCLNLVDPILKADTSSMEDIVRCVHIGLLCVQELAVDRPSMAAVVPMLSSPSITLPTPFEPPCFKHAVYRSSSMFHDHISSALPSSEHQLCRHFSFGELQLATNNFDDASIIGRGGFGKVYKGAIDNGASIVAIKRLNSGSHQGGPEFRTEVELLPRFRHSHLVPLIGYCDECHEMILVYKYMPRGTLADHLHKIDKSSHAPLFWVQRLKICIGAARGLDYLHTGTGVKDRIIHRDVKSSNILLDEDWEAKISDFGMSKVGPANQSCTHVSTHVKGTFGYLDPNYNLTGQLTRKSDVYSFGVVLFEVLCGRPAVDIRLDDEEQWGLAGWAKHCVKGGKVDQIIDISLQGKILSDCLMVFVQIAEQCLHSRPKKRPTMAEVVVRLEYALALQERTYSLMVEEESLSFSEAYDNQDDAYSSVEHEVITARSDDPNVQPTESDIGRKKLVGEGFSVEGEGTVHSSMKTGDGGRHAKHVSDDTRLGDASSMQSRTRSPRLPCWKRFRSLCTDSASVNSDGSFLDEDSTLKSLRYSFRTISLATLNFSYSRKLGDDESGRIYKGILPNGQEIAVKRLSEYARQEERDFKNNVFIAAKLQHENLVRFLGFCIEAAEEFLIYEFMPNASVAQFLSDRVKSPYLDWHKRWKIIGGVARGLLYLHEDSQERTVHRYINAGNVLLDAEMNPKIAFFGLGRSRMLNEAQGITTIVHRPIGYVAPEYAMYGQYTMKSDVFSFSVLVLEIISGRKTSNLRQSREKGEDLLSDAWKCWRKETCLNLVDPIMKVDTSSMRDIVRCIHIGLLGVQEIAADRPSMAAVVAMLSSLSVTLPVPSKPAYFMRALSNTVTPNTCGGYMAPECATHGQFSEKSDVFSFGVLVLEIISGQKNYCFQKSEKDLLSYKAILVAFVAVRVMVERSTGILQNPLPSGMFHYHISNLTMLYFFFLHLPLFTFVGNIPTPYSAVDDSLHDRHPPSAPKLQKLGLAFDSGNPIANGAIILIVLLNIIVYYLRKLQESNLDDKEKRNNSLSLPSSEHQLCRCFSFNELQLATNNFDDASVIGKGGFGKVYKGVIDNGASILAIKRLNSRSHQGAPEFRTEIDLLSRFRHSHLVSLIGYCDECHEMILVYKYMPRGTLADRLHKIDKSSHAPLSWVQRLKICIGAARGLDYLHTGTGFKDRVIHRDVKSSNILLDEDWAAKISDFGMSKVGPANQSCTNVSTNVKGTFGYLDPDYYLTHVLTRKSDVYSFGVVLFEVLCGRPAIDIRLDDEEQWGLAGWAKHCIKGGKVDQIIDPSLQGKILSDSLMVFVQIAEQCLHNRPKKRPTMAEVVVRLEYALALQERTSSLMVEEESLNFSEAYDSQDDAYSSVEHELITARSDGLNVQPIGDDLGRKKLVREGLSVEGEGTVDSSINDGDGGHHAKHIHDDTRLGDASSRLSRTRPPRLTFWKRFQSLFRGSASVNSGGSFLDVDSTLKSLQYSFRTISVATGDFSDTCMLGEDAFGPIYKGILPDGQEIAVKRLSEDSRQGELEFKNEVLLVAKLQHRNLVRLLGFCMEAAERLLIYEFMPNASVEHFLSALDRVKRPYLDWHKRWKIIGGVARGLLYLHEDSHVRFIHRDLKPSNVLLDTEMNPKIADFGLARSLVLDETQGTTTELCGTFGYMAPEYAMHGQYSMKSDVFSFGVLVLEIVSGQKTSTFRQGSKNAEDLRSYAWNCWRKGTCLNLVDPILKADTSSVRDILRCIHIGLLCVQELAADRPSMAAVVLMLSSPSVTLPVPSEPAYFMHGTISPESETDSAGSRVSDPKMKAGTSPMGDIVSSMFHYHISILIILYFFFLRLPLFTFAGNIPPPYSAVDDSLYDGHPPSAPKLRKLLFAFDFGNPIANGAIILIALLNVIVYYLRELQESNLDDKQKRDYSLPLPFSEHQLCRRFSFGELQLATNNFDDASVIGQGGFGKVYKGVIDNGASIVAIKRLNYGSHQGAPEFRTEIELLSRFRHSHIVPLIGYCDECHEMILVYKYMPRGTLADHLHNFDESSLAPLSWVQRLNISIGAARGLDYLHTGTGFKDRVIHRDVKSSNILLEEDWAAKISDFGMSKVGPANQSCTYVRTRVKGTFGYFDPNYYLTGRLTRKSDVYSFGVVLFEVMCGRPAVDTRLNDEEQWGLAGWAKHCIKEGKVDQIIDPSLQGKILSDCLMVFVQIAEQCLHNRPKKRPTMAEVVVRLEYALALQQRTYSLMVEEESLNFSEAYDNHDDAYSSVEHEVINASSDDLNVQPIEGDLGRKKLGGAGFSIEGDGTVDSSVNNGDGGRHAKHIHDNTRLGDASSRQSRTRPPRGILPNGQEIAVKRLSRYSTQGEPEFKNEVVLLANLQHRNLARFLGFCSKAAKRLLIYEFMPNASVSNILYDRVKHPYLDWQKRWKIIGGVARGLLYLHEDSRVQITHRNLHINNVLLDIDMNPRLSGFGFARSLMLDETQGTTSIIRATSGWIAPEYAMHGQCSIKSDVFSFGVLVLQTVSGQKAGTFLQGSENAEDLLSYAWKCWRTGMCLNLVDPILKADTSSMQDIVRCIHVGLLCVQELAADRPSMAAVILMLSSLSVTLPMPSEPAYFKHGSISSELESDSAGSESPVVSED